MGNVNGTSANETCSNGTTTSNGVANGETYGTDANAHANESIETPNDVRSTNGATNLRSSWTTSIKTDESTTNGTFYKASTCLPSNGITTNVQSNRRTHDRLEF